MFFTLETIFFTLTFIQSSQCYLGVMLVPGIGPSEQMFLMQNEIVNKHQGTDVITATFDSGLLSITNSMWTQVFNTYNSKTVTDFLARNRMGFHVVSWSQGTAVTRGMIEYFGMPVVNYISLAGIHMGQYGIPLLSSALSSLGLETFEGMSKEDLYLILYTPVSQDTLTAAGYWRDPCHYHYQLYLDNCKFLPVINNEVTHINSTRFKDNFIAIKKFYAFDSPDDGTVFPWQSGHFGSLECNGTVTETMDQKIYIADLIGLRTLNERNDFFHEVVPGFSHDDFITNLTFIDEKVLPLLT